MKTLRQAVAEYMTMRRNLGFQLREAGKALLDFVTFTQWYLESAPELMREAMRRLEQHWEGRS